MTHPMQADKVMYNTGEVLFRHRANTHPQRDSLFTNGPSEVIDHVTGETASGSKRGIDATKNLRAII